MSTSKAVFVFLFSLVASVSCQAQCPGQTDADVLILGAGMAGLGAAETLSQRGITNFLIIDQRDKIGGRIQTEEFGGGIVELGPQWLARDDPDPSDVRHPFDEYVARCGVQVRPIPFGFLGGVSYNSRGENIRPSILEGTARYQAAVTPDIVRTVLDGLPEDEDLSVSQGLRIGGWNPRTQLEEHVEYLAFDAVGGYPAARESYRGSFDPDLVRLRQNTFANTSVNTPVINYPEGYYAIPRCIADGFLVENDTRLILETAIVEIQWGDDCVCAISRAGERYCAPYAILTFSVGELQNGFVKFTPELPFIKKITLNQHEMVHFLKIYVAFNETFWDDDVDIITYLNEFRGREYYPAFLTWGAQFPERTHVLEAIVQGLDESKRIAYQDPEITRQEIAQVMRDIYGERASEPVDIMVNNFIANPYFFGNILTQAVGVDRRQFDEMTVPVGNLYFSGDSINFNFRGTAHGCFLHGRETGARIAEIMQGPLQIDFINDTPRVEGNTIIAEFRTSKRADSIQCFIIANRRNNVDCSSGQFSISVDDGYYTLHLVARLNAGREVATESRALTVSTEGKTCGAHLLNNGVSVSRGRATIEFSSSGLPVSGFLCSLDNAPQESCQSPLELRELAPGRHRVRVDPVCKGLSRRVVTLFDVEEHL